MTRGAPRGVEGPEGPRRRDALYGALSIVALTNLAAGIVLALTQPERAHDLRIMSDWCHQWVIGARLYTGANALTDYPPNGIVTLSPLALLPWRWAVPAWTMFGVALTPLLPILVVRALGPFRGFALAIAILLFACWAGARVFLQFTLLSMTLGFASLLLMDTSPALGGVLLGFAFLKPHGAFPIALWAIVTRRISVLVSAAAVILAEWIVFDLRVGENPFTTLHGYLNVLAFYYTGPDGLVGRTSLRAWTWALADPRWADLLWMTASGALLALVWRAATHGSGPRLEHRMAVVSAASLWVLLVLYQNASNLVLMLPAFVFMMLLDDPDSRSRRLTAVGCLQAVLMFDVPTRLERFTPAAGWLRFAIVDFDRVVVLLTFAYVLSLQRRLGSGHRVKRIGITLPVSL